MNKELEYCSRSSQVPKRHEICLLCKKRWV